VNPSEVNERIQKVVEYCRSLTLRLIRLSADQNKPSGIASGFLMEVGGFNYLISAGHALEKSGWVIETDFTIANEGRTVCIPMGGSWIIKKLTLASPKLESVDIAWAKVDLESFQRSIQNVAGIEKGKKFEYLIYKGPSEDSPNSKDPHVFASWNRGALDEFSGKTYLMRDYSYEYLMEFTGTRSEDGLYVFSIPKHKGHDYYRGASGSPIVDPTGKIVAILVKGCEGKNELYGFPMRGLVRLIAIGAQSESKTA
jgi:hypothetical protein